MPKIVEEIEKGRMGDNWADKLGSTHNGTCASCMYFLNARCRRHAPKGQEGWPAVYSSDYCGDHKLNKESMF